MCKNLSVKKVKGVYYVKGKGLWKGYCSICGKKRKVTAHHLIPKRIHSICTNKFLKELRISICKKCEDQLHPENLLINESDIIKMREKHIVNLKHTIDKQRIKMNGIKAMMNLLKKQTASSIGHIINILNVDVMHKKFNPKNKESKIGK